MKRTIKRLVKWLLRAIVDWLEVFCVATLVFLLLIMLASFVVSLCAVVYSFVLLCTGHFVTGFSLLFVSFFISVMLYQLFPKALRV